MKLLLDTHVLLWWLDDPKRLSDEAREAIADGANTVYVSSAVVWEIVIKKSLGNLTSPDDLEDVIASNLFEPLPISIAHALAVEKLPPYHRDPFDRILVAQAINESLTLVSRDVEIRKYPARQIIA